MRVSRSRQRTPISGISTAHSEKWWKRLWHGKWRRRVKAAIRQGDDVLPHYREVDNIWSGPKDGKAWFGFEERFRKLWRK